MPASLLPRTNILRSPTVWPYGVGRRRAAGSVNEGITSPWVESLACGCSDGGCECGGLAAAELKKNDEETEGNDETESEEGLSGGEGKAPERGEDGAETLVIGMIWSGNESGR